MSALSQLNCVAVLLVGALAGAGTPGQAAASTCKRANALAAVVERAWSEGLSQDIEIRVAALGPYKADEFVRRHSEAPFGPLLRERLGKRSFYYVHIVRAEPAAALMFGGDYTGLVDARTCEVLMFGKGK